MYVYFLGCAFSLVWVSTYAVANPAMTVALTTSTTIGVNSSINPSFQALPEDFFDHPVSWSLNNVLFTQMQPVSVRPSPSGTVDLNFTLTIGVESVSQMASYGWKTSNNIALTGAKGAIAYLSQIDPLVFEFSVGSLYITDSLAINNLLGRPVGAAKFASLLFSSGYFVPVPEPPTTLLLTFGLAPAIFWARLRRIRKN
jgi:hypothetical protein